MAKDYLRPTIGITANLTVVRNKVSGAVFLASQADEDCQLHHDSKFEVLGDLTHKHPGADYHIRLFAESILHGDEEHRTWLKERAERYIVGEGLANCG